MSMNVGGGAGVKSEINVTPLVDVVLVLLIIFMVVTPLLQMGYDANVPPELKTNVPVQVADQLIVRLDKADRVFINKEQVPRAQFGSRLHEVIKGRENRLIFFAADGDVTYDKVMEFMDLVRASGATNLGIVFDDLRSDLAPG